jgi:hypothetical protein
MNAQIRTLKAEIAADVQVIAGLYTTLEHYTEQVQSEEQVIVTGYYLHNLYSAFENIFLRIARAFGNQVTDQASWHAGLLHRMTLDIEGLRPRVISDQALDCLDEMRRFRHVFRNAYTTRLDATRLALVWKKAQALQQVYRAELDHFLAFLDSLDRQA